MTNNYINLIALKTKSIIIETLILTSEIKVLRDSQKLKVLIATHCFYDNPHGYDEFMFPDFYEWLHFLGKISDETNYDWYLKSHPDPLPGTFEVLNEISTCYPNISVIPYDTSHHQIIDEGINVVLTGFGTIGHEYPYFGIPVINCAFNPHIAYNFNWHAKSVNHYKELLLNLASLNISIDKNEMYEFYYMNYKYTNLDDLIYNSHSQMTVDLDEKSQFSLDAYIYFIKKLSEEKNKEIKINIKKFIKSNKKNYYIKGPEN